ncbi:MAG: enoyl-CoA hydratase/isomerase family protein [Sphingomonadales bacterium]
MSEQDIIFSQRGAIGHVLLNRPKALNALTLDMTVLLRAQLNAWATDDSVMAVLVEGAGEKGFCAGGDIRWLHDTGKEDPVAAAEFYRREYLCDAAVYHFPKPYLAFIDGIVMGGGVGISVHGSHRIAGDRTLFAMPETGIGLFPDVGGSYFLPRMPGQLGMYLGLTGARLKAADSVFAGVATHYMPSGKQAAAIDQICTEATSTEAIDAILAAHAGDAGPAPLAGQMEDINSHFDGADMRSILTELDQDDSSDWAKKQASILRSKSPTSLKVTFEQLTRGASLDFDEAMRMEMRMAARVMEGHDFYEGVRATIFEKGATANWNPARVEDVTPEMVAAYFEPLGARELEL